MTASHKPRLETTTAREQSQRKAAVGTVAAGLLAVVCTVAGYRLANRSAGIDFYQFWVVAQAAPLADTGNVYSDAERQRLGEIFSIIAAQDGRSQRQMSAARSRPVLETYSTPFLYAAFGLVAMPDYDLALSLYRMALLASLVFGVVLIARTLGYSWATALVAVGVFSLLYEPVRSDLRVGNVNGIQLGLLALFIGVQARGSRRWRDLIGGVILGLCIAMKPNVLPTALLVGIALVFERRYRSAVALACGVAGGALAAIGFSAWYFGSLDCWLEWLRAVGTLGEQEIIPVRYGNFSLAHLVQETTGWHASAPILLLLGLVVIAALAHRRRATATADAFDARQLVLLVGLGQAVSLLGSSLSWIHYYVLCIPLFVYFLHPGTLRRVGRRAAGWLAPAICVIGLVILGLHGFSRSPVLTNPVVACLLYSLIAASLFACGVRSLAKPSPAQGTE